MGVAIKWGLTILLMLTIGCASSVKTIVTDPQGETWIVQSKRDALVSLKQGNMELIVNNKGKLSWLEGVLQYVLAKPDISLSNKGSDD